MAEARAEAVIERSCPLLSMAPSQSLQSASVRSAPDDGSSGSGESELSYAICVPPLPTSHDTMPAWFQSHVSPAIVRGYRPAGQSPRFYVTSLTWLTNETINIWSHLTGAVAFAAQLCGAARAVDDPYLITYRLAAFTCFAFSTAFHLLMPFSERVYVRLQRGDFAAIFVLIGGTAIPFYSLQYDCHRDLLAAALSCTAVLTVLLAGVVGSSQAWFSKDTPRSRGLRALAFTAFAATCAGFGGASVFIGFSAAPYFEAEPALKPALYAAIVLYIAAPVLYAAGWPEKLRPGMFDFLGASHQWMHLCTVTAALINSWCMERMRELRPLVASCRLAEF